VHATRADPIFPPLCLPDRICFFSLPTRRSVASSLQNLLPSPLEYVNSRSSHLPIMVPRRTFLSTPLPPGPALPPAFCPRTRLALLCRLGIKGEISLFRCSFPLPKVPNLGLRVFMKALFSHGPLRCFVFFASTNDARSQIFLSYIPGVGVELAPPFLCRGSFFWRA